MKFKFLNATIAGSMMLVSGAASAGLLFDQNLINGVHLVLETEMVLLQ